MKNESTNTYKLLYPELSYTLNGLCYAVHNEIGRFALEKQYCNLLEQKLIQNNITYQRELIVGDSGNRLDFLIDNKLIMEIKAKPFLNTDDYYQVQRYLQNLDIGLGLLVNFRSKYLKPRRILKSYSLAH